MALATALVALTSCNMSSVTVIEAIAGQCGLDNKSVQNLMGEVMAAKIVAEADMSEKHLISRY